MSLLQRKRVWARCSHPGSATMWSLVSMNAPGNVSYKMVMVEMVLTSKALTRDWGETELVNAETTT